MEFAIITAGGGEGGGYGQYTLLSVEACIQWCNKLSYRSQIMYVRSFEGKEGGKRISD
jgi:hypothetical protein